MTILPGGSYADYAKVHKDLLINIPEKFSWEHAAAIPEVFITAYQLLHFCAKAKEGDSVLILAAASGVGTSMIQLCKKSNLKAIAVASNDDKLETCKSLGAQAVINYKQFPKYSENIKEITAGKGVNII